MSRESRYAKQSPVLITANPVPKKNALFQGSWRYLVCKSVKDPVTFIDRTAMKTVNNFIIKELEDFQMCKESRRFF